MSASVCMCACVLCTSQVLESATVAPYVAAVKEKSAEAMEAIRHYMVREQHPPHADADADAIAAGAAVVTTAAVVATAAVEEPKGQDAEVEPAPVSSPSQCAAANEVVSEIVSEVAAAAASSDASAASSSSASAPSVAVSEEQSQHSSSESEENV